MENMNKLKDMESLEKRLENIELIMTIHGEVWLRKIKELFLGFLFLIMS